MAKHMVRLRTSINWILKFPSQQGDFFSGFITHQPRFFLDFVDHHGIHLCGGWFSYFFLGVVFHHVELQNLKAAQRCGPKITASSMLDKKRLGAMGSRVFPGTALDLMWNDGFCLVGNHPHNMLPGLVNIQKTIENGHRNS